MLNHPKQSQIRKSPGKALLGVEASSSLIYIFLPGDALSAWKVLRGPSDEAPEAEDAALEGMTSLLFARNTAPDFETWEIWGFPARKMGVPP